MFAGHSVKNYKWIYLFDVKRGCSAPDESNAYVVAACSPLSDYSAFSKLEVYRLYMPVWSEAELLTCQTKCDRIKVDANTIKLLYSIGGWNSSKSIAKR
jgi:GH18 family chitinase